MQLLRTITAACLLIGISMPLLSPVCLQLRQLHIQHEMIEKLEKESLLTIRVKTASIQWVKPKKECALNGEMFDIKWMQVIGDETILTGLYDEKEKELKRMLRRQTDQESKQAQHMLQLFFGVAPPAQTAQQDLFVAKSVIAISLFRISLYHSPFLGFQTPPPKQDHFFI
jgi:hypothetical protein